MPITRDYTSLPLKVRPSGPHPKSQSAPDSTPEDTTLTPARSQSPEAYGPDRMSNYKRGGAVKKKASNYKKGGVVKKGPR